jgi:peptidoglycan/xylan/chitin deacetylase (PgdA/CDA1 family)
MLDTRIRPALRDAVARLGAVSRFTRAARSRAGCLTVVTFHRVLPAGLRARYPHPGLAMTPGELEFVLEALRRDYTLGSLAELDAPGEPSSRPDRARRPRLALTFDDGQLDNFEHARPLLARYGVRATFFVPVDAIASGAALWHDRLGYAAVALSEGRGGARARERVAALGLDPRALTLPHRITQAAKRLTHEAREALVDELAARTGAEVPPWAGMMSFAELRALADEGHEIGSHSMTHPLLPSCDDARVEFEIAESKRRLEAAIGREVESFCYPNGDWDARCVAALGRAGYRRAVITLPGVNRSSTPRFLLTRHDLDPFRLRDRHGALSAPLLAWRLWRRSEVSSPAMG